MYDTSEGTVYIDQTPIKEVNLLSLRGAIGAVPQDAFLFSDSIKNNIKFGKETATDEEVILAAKKAAVHKNIKKFKDQYDTVLGERGITLSGGQNSEFLSLEQLLKMMQLSIYLMIVSQLLILKLKKKFLIT